MDKVKLAHYKELFNNDHNPVMYLGIDPGKSNGICGYDAKFYLVFMLTIQEEDMYEFLGVFERVINCVIEDFRLYPNKSKEQIYSDMLTSRVIGRVESWASLKNIQLIKQGAHIKSTGYKWLGQKPPKKSDPKNHMMDANVHFMYYAVKNRLVDARVLLRDTEVK